MSGNHPLFSQFAIKPLVITAGAATVSNTASFYIEGAATTTVVSGKNYSLWVDNVGLGGTSLIDGTVLLSTTAGNVGIGTTSPYSKLSVWGSGTGIGQAFSVINNASTTLMQILDNGNVGIGTTTPGSLLSIQGIANFTTGTTTFYGNGINIAANQCYAVNGTCLSGGSLSAQAANTVLANGTGGSAVPTAIATSTLYGIDWRPNVTHGWYLWRHHRLVVGDMQPLKMKTLRSRNLQPSTSLVRE